jgi:death-on-curing family protein
MEKTEKIIYPSAERIIEYNSLALNIIKAKKADTAKVLSFKRIINIIEGCKNLEGDVYDKAVFLLKGLIQKHPFASGNRRTAFIVTKEFLLNNKAKLKVKDDPKYARVMIGIREDFYKDSEIKEWIKNGKIREFTR